MSSRSLVDRPDDFSGAQVHVIYAVPKGATDQQFDVTSRIPYSLSAVNKWLDTKLGRKVKFDTYKGDLDIQFIQLPKTDAEYGNDDPGKFYSIEADTFPLQSAGKIYLVFYDGRATPQACAQAYAPGPFAVVYMQGNCWQGAGPAASADAQPSAPDFLLMHELFHTLGAPHTPQLTSEQRSQLGQTEYFNLACDLMYSPKDNTCTFLGWFLDPYQKFYYSATGFADGHLNTYNSTFLTPAPPR